MSGLFNNTLQLWQWAVLAAVPPLIVLLYFLKLKRRPLEVPSTYLWRRAIEDLHVNSIWQRIRRNVLLFLQLLLVALIMLAVLRPGCRGTTLVGDRFIFLIDTSASMGAKEPGGSRLELAKRRVVELIDQMLRGDVAMIISFSNEARIEQSFTDNRRLLRERVQRIQGTARPSDLLEALRAASGLANPGQTSEAGNPVDCASGRGVARDSISCVRRRFPAGARVRVGKPRTAVCQDRRLGGQRRDCGVHNGAEH